MLSTRAIDPATAQSPAEDLITRVAWLYYKQKLTQQEIAGATRLSRQKVQRLLERARDLEIIKFDIKHPYHNLLSIEEELRKGYSLRDAVVVPWRKDADEMRKAYAMAAAAYLERQLQGRARCTLGLGWGNTTVHLADYFEPTFPAKNRVRVVSLIGNLTMNVVLNPYIMGMKISEKLDAPFYNIWAPAITQSKERADSFRSEPWIAETLETATQADLVLLSIGEVTNSATLFKMGYLSRDDLERILRKRAVGDILCRFFDIDGNQIDDPIHDRVVGIPLESLADDRKTVIAVAGGASKARAIVGAIRGGFIDVLVTDEKTAGTLVNFNTTGGKERNG